MALSHVGVNRCNEFRDAPEHAAPKLFDRQIAQDTLHQIEPRATGRGVKCLWMRGCRVNHRWTVGCLWVA